MKIRSRSLSGAAAALLAAALVAGNAFAQQPQSTVARLIGVQGNVLVSRGDAMVTAVTDQRLPVGSRVVTTAGATATINFDAGCEIRLTENQRFTVQVGPCAALLAAVESVGPAAGAIGGGTATAAAATGGTVGLLSTTTAGWIAAGAVMALGVYQTVRNDQVSPN